MPTRTCSLCGAAEDVAKWHPDYEPLRAQEARADASRITAHVCDRCAVRVRAEAARQTGHPSGQD